MKSSTPQSSAPLTTLSITWSYRPTFLVGLPRRCCAERLSSSASICAVFGGLALLLADHVADRDQQPKFAVDYVDVAHARSVCPYAAGVTSPSPTRC